MMLSGVFDRFPDLTVILGHWCEVILFYLERINLMQRVAKLPRSVEEYVRDHVSVGPSRIFSERHLRWASEVVGNARILFSTDYPFAQPSGEGRHLLETADLSESARVKSRERQLGTPLRNFRRWANV